MRLMQGTMMTLCASAILFYPAKRAEACGTCQSLLNSLDSSIWEDAENELEDHVDNWFLRVERFIVGTMWGNNILPTLMLSAEQFTAIALQQAMIIGTFIDATNQMETQQLLQELRAQAHKEYHPSEGLCTFGSVVKSIAASERRGEITSLVLSHRSLDRQLGQGNTSSTYGFDLDKTNRIFQFKTRFCNEKDRENALAAACSALVWDDNFIAEERVKMDKDIDYFSLVDAPWTLKLDFTNNRITDTTVTPNIRNEDEENVMAMAANLFAHNTFPRPPSIAMKNVRNQQLTEMQKAYLDLRSIVAKRSIAENSFNAIAAMKAEGNVTFAPSGGTTPEPMHSRIYMQSILSELGVPDPEALSLLGENPSYYAQMEILTKKIYQNPEFYTNLYDKPANVERKTVALQAVKLMQKFDMLKSHLRGEASFSVLLELSVVNLQREIEDQIKSIDTSADRSL